MPKQYNIKWRDIDAQKLSQAVRNFNQKRRRLINKNPELEKYLPEAKSVRTLKKEIKTRRTFNQTLKSLQRFSKKGSEQLVTLKSGTTITKYEKQEARYNYLRKERFKANIRKRANVSTEKGTMGTIREMNLAPSKFNINSVDAKRWRKFFSSLEKQGRNEYYTDKDKQYARNYKIALKQELGKFGDDILTLLDKIDFSVIVDAYYEEASLEINEPYTEKDREENANYIYENWINYLTDRGLIEVERNDEDEITSIKYL